MMARARVGAFIWRRCPTTSRLAQASYSNRPCRSGMPHRNIAVSMRRLLLAIALLIPLAACETTRIGVRDVERMRFQAMVHNDLKSLEPLLAENLVYLHT